MVSGFQLRLSRASQTLKSVGETFFQLGNFVDLHSA